MAVDDRMRLRIHHKLEALIGTEEADALVTNSLPAPGQELATKTDVRVLSTELRGEMTQLRSELRGEMAELRSELRGEMAELRGDVRGEIEQLRGEMGEMRGELRGEMGEMRGELRGEMGEMRGEIGGLRGELRGEIHAAVARQTRWMIGFMMSWSAVVVAAARLLF